MSSPKRQRLDSSVPLSPDANKNVQSQLEQLLIKVNELTKKSDEMPTLADMVDQLEERDKKIEELEQKLKESEKGSYIKQFPAKEKKFSLKHTIRNVSSITEKTYIDGDTKNHFGKKWRISIRRLNGHVYFFLGVVMDEGENEWRIETKNTFRLFKSDGTDIKKTCNSVYEKKLRSNSWGLQFMKWEEFIKLAVDDEIKIGVDAIITKMTGAAKQNFDETRREFADVVLTVEGEDFYVLKKFLASKSSYFKSMFFSNFVESTKYQIDLPNIDVSDFQNFLEAIHGEADINDSSIEGILHLAHMYDAPSVLKSCEKFMIQGSTMTSDKKFQLSKKYGLEKLEDQCISGMDVNEIDAALKDVEKNSATTEKLAKQLVILYQRDILIYD